MPGCFCGLTVSNNVMLLQHITEKGHSLRCSCGLLSRNLANLQIHQSCTDHVSFSRHPDHLQAFVEFNIGPRTTKSCTFCGAFCKNVGILAEHLAARHPACADCAARFAHENRLNAHRHDTGHCFCRQCNIAFDSNQALGDHMTLKHPACPRCGARFMTQGKLNAHRHNTGHCFCRQCKIAFDSTQALRDHLLLFVHVSECVCLACDRGFPSQDALDQHLKDFDHERGIDTAKSAKMLPPAAVAYIGTAEGWSVQGELFKCDPCDRTFQEMESLKSHLLSTKHRPLKCPLSLECTKQFRSPSALVAHPESGACKSGMDRKTLNGLVQAYDHPGHLITTEESCEPNALTSSNLSSLSCPEDVLDGLTPSCIPSAGLSKTISTPTTLDDDHEEDNRSLLSGPDGGVALISYGTWVEEALPSLTSSGVLVPSAGGIHNTSEWSMVTGLRPRLPDASFSKTAPTSSANVVQRLFCPLCPSKKVWSTAVRLQRHLGSAAHTPKIFQCPDGLLELLGIEGRKHTKRFNTLSGLAQHLEAGACAGGEELFKKAMAFVEFKMKSLGFGTYLQLLLI